MSGFPDTNADGAFATGAVTLGIAGRPIPVVGPARMYVCGITPYDATHLGHARTFVWADVVARVLRHVGGKVRVCRNVTDVDDVLNRAAHRSGSPYDSFAAVQQFYFERDLAALGVHAVDHQPRAHNHIREVIALTQGLLALDRAYVRDGTVYFRGADVPSRAGIDTEGALRLLAEFDDAPEDPGKDDPLDVALWRPSTSGEPAWPSPWSSGRPGWHAECAAMAMTTFGPALDLHAGGADLRFPHHAYEAAMAEALTGVRPFARTWFHVGVVRRDGAKMAKSDGNLILVGDLIQDHPATAVRLMLLTGAAWSEDWDYSPGLLVSAAARLDRLHRAAGRPGSSTAAEAAVTRALLDDLDVATGLAIAEEEGGRTARLVMNVLALG
ncbi:cysteine--tRNA ligase [Actinomadura sp. NBRC 104412]|uniref:class I tRNA ligase family protein n=1 Tax=Actinomadura sp. NBRC 104412 TaxID=3032203 RepID=UPI0024A55830|nr:class I tRNA ligase family protein [Actinomadura sp. NBRC 104412]GLZ06234.1 cysteine--tRNA ligase [Actinomadura sp. NBRC 104412]